MQQPETLKCDVGVLCFMRDPKELSVSPFFHYSEDGAYHSVCRVCFQTVSEDPRESKLIRGEEAHQCKGSPRVN